ncbi:MFS transporter [Pseudomonas stutzeri]|uniref:MFS transporter n=1 Tax=Stutzerimonas stutzeri TaxID=316 RepID=UPI00210B6439|nr:MFS transporter [Stutzerimonas stutzeri]MCQ4306713.1 MFS transporter [Stutzerimonas stutzeri]
MPGSPAILLHPMPMRIAYACVAVLVGLTGGLGNALFIANLPSIQGDLGLTPSQAAWLPAAYFMVNVSANLLMIKFRQQYGLRRFAEIGLTLYALLSIAHVFVEGLEMAVFVRAASGLAAATTSSLGLFYMLQAFRKADLPKGVILGFGISQLGTPLAWLMSPALLDLGEWHRLYVFESGLALCSLAAVVVLKLPLGERIKVFEPLDFLTFALLAPALALIAAVLAQGRILWWTEEPWLGYALIAALLLMCTAFMIEHHRRNPLLHTRWLGTAEMLRFAFGALALRLLLSEQTYGAVGLLQTLGMGTEQLQPLYAVILLGLSMGIAGSAMTFSPTTALPQILLSIVLIAVASFLDLDATNLTRPHDMFLSQGLLAFASGMFLGPLLITGIGKALRNGPNYLVSFIVLFTMTQSLGGLAAPALFGTYQVVREKYHSSHLTEQVVPSDPRIAQRLQAQSQALAPRQSDPQLRQAQSAAQLSQATTREANVLAFNDVFRLIGMLAIGVFGWTLYHTLRLARQNRNAPPP